MSEKRQPIGAARAMLRSLLDPDRHAHRRPRPPARPRHAVGRVVPAVSHRRAGARHGPVGGGPRRDRGGRADRVAGDREAVVRVARAGAVDGRRRRLQLGGGRSRPSASPRIRCRPPYLAIINATSPLFGAVIARVWLGEALDAKRLVGVAAGLCGVAALVGLGPVQVNATTLLACFACLLAASSYGFAGNYTKQLKRPVPPTDMATGSQVAAALVMLPLIPFDPLPSMPTARIVWANADPRGRVHVGRLPAVLPADQGSRRDARVDGHVPDPAVSRSRGPGPSSARRRRRAWRSVRPLVIAATWLIVSPAKKR